MSTTTETPAAPDLSSLPKRQRLNVKVAATQSTEFTNMDGVTYFLRGTHEVASIWPNGNTVAYYGPDYAGDPAAWGALMEREGVWVEPMLDRQGNIDSWLGHYRGGNGHMTARVAALGVSVCCAVLAKFGISPTPYIGD